jgi:PAS domain S-box-containing protein
MRIWPRPALGLFAWGLAAAAWAEGPTLDALVSTGMTSLAYRAFFLVLACCAVAIGVKGYARHRRRREIAASELRFRGLFQSLAFGAAQHEMIRDETGKPVDYRVIDINAEYERLLGVSRADVIGKRATEIYGEAFYIELYADIVATGARRTYELPFRDRIYRTVAYSPGPEEFVTLFEDTTELKRAQQRLSEAEERYRLVTEATSDVVWDWDLVGGGIYLSPRWWEITGYTREELPESYAGVMSIIEGEDRQITEGFIARNVKLGENYKVEFRIVAKGGGVRWILERGRVVAADEEGRPTRALGSFIDVSDRHLALEALASQTRELSAKNAELERFTYTVSHDLKSPLITIKGFLGFIRKDAESGDLARLEADLGRVEKAADRMHRLLDDLLELSRVGRIVDPPALFNSGEAVATALENLDALVRSSGAVVETPKSWPRLRADRTRVVAAFQNLIENAIKYSGGRTPKIRIGCVRRKDRLEFFVADEGLGIEPQYLETVWGLFNQLDPKAGGTGIGLALVRRIAETHGGRAWAESEGAGRGSTFWLSLPAPGV